MYLHDLAGPGGEVFVVKWNILNENEIRQLVLQCKAKHSLIPVTDRVEMFPFMINGTTMAHPQDLPRYPPFSPTQQALIGMPDIRVLGLPSFHLQPAGKHTHLITLPTPLARLSFHGIETTIDTEAIQDSSDVASQLGDQLTFGNIWTHEFQADTDLTALYQRQFALMPSLNPNLPAGDFINSSLLTVWFQKSDRRLAWLNHLGALGQVKLVTGPDGLPGYHGMPLEVADHLYPPNTSANAVIVALQDPRNAPLLAEPFLTPDHLLKIIDVLCTRPKNMTHVAWGTAAKALEDGSRDCARMKALQVLEILNTAKASCMEDWDRLTAIVDSVKRDYKNALNADVPLRGWIPQCMVRMVGRNAPSDPDAQWWVGRPRSAMELSHDDIVWSSIEGPWQRLGKAASDFTYHNQQRQRRAKLFTEKAVRWMENFLELQKNGLLIELVNAEMEDIRRVVREAGFGCRLT